MKSIKNPFAGAEWMQDRLSLRMAGFAFLGMLFALAMPQAHAEQAETFDSPGAHTFTVPDGVSEITVEAWGAGGRGGSTEAQGNRRTGGGGGGAYASSIFEVSPGDSFSLNVGEGSQSAAAGGDSVFENVDGDVIAAGGGSVPQNSQDGAAGGSEEDSQGNLVSRSGGDGADRQSDNGGGGGSSAGPDSVGATATSRVGAVAPDGGGDGGDGGIRDEGDSENGQPGVEPGGGGGGATSKGTARSGGRGGDGRVRITYETSEAQLSFEQQPSNTLVDQEIEPGVTVRAEDAQGNLMEDFDGDVEIALESNPGSADLSGTLTVPASDGVAIFDDLIIDEVGDGYTLRASASNMESAISTPFDIVDADVLLFGNSEFDSVEVAPGQLLELSVTASGCDDIDADLWQDSWVDPDGLGVPGTGSEEFGSSPCDRSPVRELVAPDSPGESFDVTFTSEFCQDLFFSCPLFFLPWQDYGSSTLRVDVVSGFELSFDQQPSDSFADETISPPVTVEVLDEDGSLVDDYDGDISLSIAENPSGGTLSGTTAVGVQNGMATFANLTIDEPGVGYTLEAAAGIATSAESEPFTILEEQLVVDRFRIEHPSEALTCRSPTIEIRACADEACNLVEESFEAELTPTGQALVFDGEPLNVDVVNTDSGPLELNVEPPEGVVVDDPDSPECVDLAGNSSDCTIVFSDSGFVLELPDFVSGEPEVTATIQAVEIDDVTNDCAPLLSGEKEVVELSATPQIPELADLNAQPDVVVDPAGNESRAIDLDGSVSEVHFDFDDTATASFTLFYPEAGRVTLNARYEDDDEESEQLGLILKGNSPFNARAQSVCPVFDQGCEEANAECATTATAGEVMEGLSLRAVGYSEEDACNIEDSGDTLANFAFSGFDLSSDVIAPEAGSDGSAEAVIDAIELADEGETPGGAARISEVGVFRLTVEPFEYLGGTVESAPSALSPRQIPQAFEHDEDGDVTGMAEAYCSVGDDAFSYSGQATPWALGGQPSLNLRAVNAQGTVTGNYTEGDFFREVAGGIDASYPDTDSKEVGVDGQALNVEYAPQAPSLSRSGSGTFDVSLSGDGEITYERSANARVEPFPPDLEFFLDNYTDQDGVSMTSESQKTLFPVDFSGIEIVFGRGRVENAFGSEEVAIPVPFRVHRFDGERFIVNDWDGCTAYDEDDFSLSDDIATLTVTSGELLMGEGEERDSLLVEPLSDPQRGDTFVIWDGAFEFLWPLAEDEAGEPEPPRGRVTLGVYRGHDRIIHWREVR
jgi:hypothetical protein